MSAILYNGKKVEKGVAEMQFSSGIPEGESPQDAILRYERGSVRTVHTCFHCSINPGPGELQTKEDAMSFTRAFMQMMGYGQQPYYAVAHYDTGRPHIHVVSVRVDTKGRKINDSFEKYKVMSIIEELAPDYDLSLGNKEVSNAAAQDELYEKARAMMFDASKGDAQAQLRKIVRSVRDSLHLSSFYQFNLYLRGYGLSAKAEGPAGLEKMIFYGIDQSGNRTTGPMHADSIAGLSDVMYLQQIQVWVQDTLRDRKRAFANGHWDDGMAKVISVYNSARKRTDSKQEIAEFMAGSGIVLEYSRNRDGVINGSTFIDYELKNCFKGSELGIYMSEIPLKNGPPKSIARLDSHGHLLSANDKPTLPERITLRGNDMAPGADKDREAGDKVAPRSDISEGSKETIPASKIGVSSGQPLDSSILDPKESAKVQATDRNSGSSSVTEKEDEANSQDRSKSMANDANQHRSMLFLRALSFAAERMAAAATRQEKKPAYKIAVRLPRRKP